LFFSPKGKPLSALQRKWIMEYSDDVIQARPRFFVVADQAVYLSNVLSRPTFKIALAEIFPDLKAFLDRNYHLVKVFDQTEVFELNAVTAGATPP
jgi:hypothetical protein